MQLPLRDPDLLLPESRQWFYCSVKPRRLDSHALVTSLTQHVIVKIELQQFCLCMQRFTSGYVCASDTTSAALLATRDAAPLLEDAIHDATASLDCMQQVHTCSATCTKKCQIDFL